MDPVFTLQWPEFVLANHLQKALPKKDGYSLLIPLSRQEKGIDLAILKKHASGTHKTVTLQIKASRAYPRRAPARESTKHYQHNTWFRRFDVPEEADFVLLFGMYVPDTGMTRTINAKWYQHCTLLFTRSEIREFMMSCLTVGGKPDQMFGFGFDDGKKIALTRGDQERAEKDYSGYLLDTRMEELRNALTV